MPNRHESMNTVIVRAPNHLGDCLMALPALRSLTRSDAEYKIYLLAPHWSRPLFDGLPLAEFIPLSGEHLHGWKGILRQSQLLRKYRLTHGIILPPSFSSALAFFLGKVKNRHGFRTDRRGFLLNDGINLPTGKVFHRAALYQSLVNHFASQELPPAPAKLDISIGSQKKAERLLAPSARGSRLVAIAPQAVAPSRRWGADNYRKLALRLISECDCKVVLLGAAAEFEAGEIVAAGNNKIINLCGKTDIGSAAAVLYRCHLFIGNDSGLAHLAAAVDIPLVVLSGADNPEETSPVSDKKTVIIKNDLSCISCVKNRCPLSGDAFMRCMKDISVDDVFNAAQSRGYCP
ncbi:MAG: lipopolysaccharide heptosyltransferase II [bacterium]